MNLKKWVPLSVPKTITILVLCALGANGLIQVHLQKAMAQKSTKLNQQVAVSKNLAKDMKSGLSGLTQLNQASQDMYATLVQIEDTTGQMDDGITLLDQTVSGIHRSIYSTRISTKQSLLELSSMNEQTKTLLSVLAAIHGVNTTAIANLMTMVMDENAINRDLSDMNRKTSLLP